MLITEPITVIDILEMATQQLARAGCDTPKLDVEVLLAYTLNTERSWLYRYPNATPNPQQLNGFWQLINRRAMREPVAYLTGHKEFFGLDLLVNRRVLIPRPETELLIETILINQVLRNQDKLLIADIGTGSGCIAITLAKHLTQTHVVATDISQQALTLARQNAAHHQVSDRVYFVVSNLLASLTGLFDVIVSNPPYISQRELLGCMPEVADYEPWQALDGGVDGLEIINQLLTQAQLKLNPNGYLLMEIGWNQGEAVKQLAQTHFPEANIEVRKDLARLDRLLIVQNRVISSYTN